MLHKWTAKFISALTVKNVRGGSRTATTSKMELFVIIVNGFIFSLLDIGDI